MHGANLPKVIRQADRAHREIVTQLARGQIKPAIAALQEMGSIREIPHRDERMAALAADVVIPRTRSCSCRTTTPAIN
jgi:hypothetical protein